MENWNVKQGVSERSVQLVREHANAPKFCGTNSSKQQSILFQFWINKVNPKLGLLSITHS
ncbi:MAG: hypothetical protein LN569_06570 [Rickettsia endosymbiont of Labidopullus appendiculatus]|nr:hypothetical protein [Rickettsia endosymbiont of Labidopullus appendiculatus]